MVLGNTNNTVNIYMFMIFSIETSPHKSSIKNKEKHEKDNTDETLN